MNRSKIEWTDFTWNPITGCLNGCPYCYAKRMCTRFAGNVRMNKMAKADYRKIVSKGKDIYILDKPFINETEHPIFFPFEFEPTYHRYRLNSIDHLKVGQKIFVCSMADMFADYIPDDWIQEIFDSCKRFPQHNYIFLTKNPDRYMQLWEKNSLPQRENFWYGTTITDENLKPWNMVGYNSFVSIEPITEKATEMICTQVIPFGRWAIIGAETGNRDGKTIAQLDWVERILVTCKRMGIPVFMKDSLIPIITNEGMRREFPEELKIHKPSPKLKEKLYDDCIVCKAHKKKNEMYTVMLLRKRLESPKVCCYICQNCLNDLSAKLQIKLPEFEEESNVNGDQK